MAILMDLLVKHEGLRLKPYRCPAGKLTIGVGRNIEDNGISEGEAYFMLLNDAQRVMREADESFSWFSGLSPARQMVVMDMIFNMGLSGFSQFKRTIQYIRGADYEQAAAEMLDSKWAGQVGSRALRLADMMANDRIPDVSKD